MQLLEVAIGLKAVVASISHHHVAIRGQCQALWAVQWLCRCVDIGQEGARAVKYLGKEWRFGERGKIRQMRGCGGQCVQGTTGSLTPMASLGLTHLDAAVAPVGYNDVSVGVHSYSRGGIELPIALTVGAKLEEELAIGTVYLAGEGAGD